MSAPLDDQLQNVLTLRTMIHVARLREGCAVTVVRRLEKDSAAASAGRLLYLLVDCVPARGRSPPLGVERRQSIMVDSSPSTIYLLPSDLLATSPTNARARSFLAWPAPLVYSASSVSSVSALSASPASGRLPPSSLPRPAPLPSSPPSTSLAPRVPCLSAFSLVCVYSSARAPADLRSGRSEGRARRSRARGPVI